MISDIEGFTMAIGGLLMAAAAIVAIAKDAKRG